jgi:acetyl esterase/lipase
MKKYVTIILSQLIVLMLLTACTDSTSVQSSSDVVSETETETETETIKLEATTETTENIDSQERDLLAEASKIEFDPDGYTDIINDVPYLDDGESYHMVDLYGTQSTSNPTPTVIEIHGGGFVGGSRANNANHSIFFAERGYNVVATDYSKIPRNGSFIDAVQDLFASYQWVADHESEYHFDLNNMFLSGDSAGGYYVILTMAIFDSPELQEYFNVTLPEFEFSGYVTTCPAADIMLNQEYFAEESGPNAHVAQTIGEEILFDDDLMSHMDLMRNVSPSAFTGLYMLTTPTDTTTGIDVQNFDAYLTEQGIEHTVMSYDGVENDLLHTFNISHADYAESKVANQDMVEYCNSLLKTE